MIDGRRAHSGGDSVFADCSKRLRYVKEPFKQGGTVVRERWSVKFREVNFISSGEPLVFVERLAASH